MQNETDYLVNEQNRLELQCSDLKQRLKKKEEDFLEIKTSLNHQIQQVDDTYKEKMEDLEEKVKTLQIQSHEAKLAYNSEFEAKKKAEEER